MNVRTFRFVFAFVAFLVPSGAGAWEAIYTRPHKVAGTDKAIAVIYKETQDGKVTQLTDIKSENGSATWSPDGTEIVFHSKRNGFEEIFMMDSDGQNARSLGFRGTYPTISRNYVAFSAPLGNRVKFRVVRRDGSTPPVDVGLVADFGSISPNEERVAFWDGSSDIVLVNIDGSGSRRLTVGVLPSFVDDNTIVYQLDVHGGEIWVYDLKSSQRRFLIEGVVPSVTSGWIVFSGDDGWTAIRPDGTGETVLAPYTRQGNFRVTGAIADSRPVEPRGKLPAMWGGLKRE